MPNPLHVLIAMGVAALILGIGYAPWNRKEGSWAIAPAIALGFMVAHRLVTGRFPPFPANDATGWLFYIAAGSAVVGLAAHLWRLPTWALALVGGAAGAGAAALVVRTMLLRESARIEAAWSIAATAVVAAAWIIAFCNSTSRSRQKTTLVSAAMLALCSGVLMGMSHSFAYGQLGAALGAAVFAVAGAAVLSRKLDPVPAVVVVCATLPPLCLAGSRFADLSIFSVVMIAIAPVAYAVAAARLITRRRLVNIVLSLVCLLVPLGIAIAAATPSFLQTISDPNDLYAQ